MNFEDLKIFLPKYLSEESETKLFDGLKDFPSNIDERLYTNYLQDYPTIFQGDGLNDLIAINLPSTETKLVPGMVLSNTCDIDPDNIRIYPSPIIYAPIIDFEKYAESLFLKLPKDKVNAHLEAVKKQFVTQIFYLPKISNKLKESLVFLSRIHSIGNEYIERPKLKTSRIFSLSDYGNYLFLFKLSMHFTRIHDKIERKSF
jgi:hypothetical protein